MDTPVTMPKVLISHSYKDRLLVDALVELLIKSGVKKTQIVSSSTPGTQLHTGKSLYDELWKELSNEKVFVIFMLSDNFYSSKVCLNEMGAAWIKDVDCDMMILPGFSFSKVEGVICAKNLIGIALNSFDKATVERFDHLRADLSAHFGFELSPADWTLGVLDFFDAVETYKKQQRSQIPFSMKECESLCVGDLKQHGCCLVGAESSADRATVVIDFSLTTSSLCSLAFHAEVSDWRTYLREKKMLCFDIYADAMNIQAEVEIHLAKGRNIPTPIVISGNMISYRIPLTQFTNSEIAWSDVTQVCFLFRDDSIKNKTKVVIENLRLEE